jgi:hypothetical protein
LLLLALALGLTAGVRLYAEAGKPAKADPAAIAKLVSQLGSDNFSDREQAFTKLEEIGTPALEALKKAAKSEDAETRRRAEDLLEKIEAKARSEELLAPTRVKLAYKDTPVPEAVADFAKRTGRPVVLSPELVQKFADRKVTVESGELSFWEALDLLSRKAGLTESFHVNVPLVPAPPGFGAKRPALARPVFMGGIDQIVLTEGKPSELPIYFGGAARVRQLPADAPILERKPADKELQIGLGVALEGTARLLAVTGVKIDKAQDDQGQSLAVIAEAGQEAPLPGGVQIGAQPGVVIINMKGQPFGGLPTKYEQHSLIRLKAGEKAAKTIKELSGVVNTQVDALEPAITIDNVMKAAGQPAVKGKEAGSLKLIEVAKQDDGQYKVTVELEMGNGIGANPIRGIGIPVPLPAPLPQPLPIVPQIQQRKEKDNQGFQVQAQPVPVAPVPVPAFQIVGAAIPPVGLGVDTPAANWGLSLVDGKGQKYQCTGQAGAQARFANNQIIQQVALIFKADREQGEPAKVIYSTHKTVTLDIPFKLKDVVLP